MEIISKIAKLKSRVIFHDVFKSFSLGLSETDSLLMWRKSSYILPYPLSSPFKILLPSSSFFSCAQTPAGLLPQALLSMPRGLRPRPCLLIIADSVPCSEPSYIKERGRWMSGPCIWHLISAASDVGFDLGSLSESLRKQSLLHS